jgi:exopolysaccharide production protein ExoQ
MNLSRLPPMQSPAFHESHGIMDKPIPKAVLIRRLEWSVCFLSLTSLVFSNFSPLPAAIGFLAGAAMFGLIRPARAVKALGSDWLPWMFVALALISISWSQAPGLSLRFVAELALTVCAALVMARGLEPRSLISVLMCALLVIDAVGLLVNRYELTPNGWAMIGAFGSKNSFSSAQAILFLTSFWVLLNDRQNRMLRLLALLGVFGCPFLLIAGRSADAVAPLIVATGLTLPVYATVRFPPRARLMSLCAGVALIVGIFSFAFVFSDTIIGQLLIITGKDATLTGRTYLWDKASVLMTKNPLLGTGYGAFWVQGNPYAEEIWRHFELINRGGFSFHNVWYQQGVDLGYLGIAAALLTLLIVSFRTARWAVRFPTAESLFFLSYVMYIVMRSFLETETFAQFTYTYVIFVAAGVYGRYAPTIKSQSAPQRAALSTPNGGTLFSPVRS